jgi:nitroreductase
MMNNSATQAPLAQSLRALLETRFSCRSYLPQQVASDTILQILSMAQRTPSWCNSQPWKVIITQPNATNRLRHALQAAKPLENDAWEITPPTEYHGVYRDRRRSCGWQLYESVGIAAGDRQASARQAAENFRFFGAPHLAVITTDKALGSYGVLDCGSYINNFMLAAASLGVASVTQAALASMAHVLREHLPIGQDRNVVCGISFGYADLSHPANGFRTNRAALDDVITYVDT